MPRRRPAQKRTREKHPGKVINARQAAAQAAFLAAYAELATITATCKLTQIGRRTHYDWMAHDPAYAKAFEEAEQAAADALEAEARRRALQGVAEPVFYQGTKCGEVQKYSDTLLIFLLKAKRPEQFKERYEHTGPNGGPIVAKVQLYMPDNRRRREGAA